MQALLNFDYQPIFAKNPRSYLEVRDGKLFQDEKQIGSATDLGKALKLKKTNLFFPAWIGFIGYEYARYFGLATNKSDDNFPDAAFFLFTDPSDYEPCLELNPISRIHKPPKDPFLDSVSAIQEEIRNGDVYQVNLSRQFELMGNKLNPFAVYEALKQRHPSPYMGVLQHPDWAIVSGSPERLFRLHDKKISTKPIAGTKPIYPGAESDLKNNLKELAEHTMLVDLMRNDLAKICDTGSVQVPDPFTIEHYRHVMHLVSEVSGKTDASLNTILHAIFPGGTITGAPKENVMRSIQRHEPYPRGPYTGSMGYVSSGHGIDFNILIRSLYIGKHKTYFSAGAGIVMGSVPEAEYLETEHKIKQFEFLSNGISYST